MPISVGVVGTGWVGASVAISTLHAGFASELLLADARHEVAEGEAMDLAHGASFYTTAAVMPEDGTIWFANEYIPNAPRTVLANWGTFIGKIQP